MLMVVWLILAIFGSPQGDRRGDESAGVTVAATKEAYAVGQLVMFEVRNNTDRKYDVRLKIEERAGGEWTDLSVPEKQYALDPGGKQEVKFPEANFEYFGEPSRFRAQVSDATTGEFLAENEFAVEEPGLFRSLWRALFYKPLESALILLLSVTGKHLAAAIVLLTLIIKLILLVPSRKGIIAQQKMQKLQPELDELRKKYADNPQLQAQKMMELWKKHKVHPGSALWPTLIQLPILISLYFVIKDGLQPYNVYLLYNIPVLQNFDFSAIIYDFLWLDLAKPDPFVILPVTIGMLQFIQLKTMTVRQQKRNAGKKPAEPSPQEAVLKMMNYFLPAIVVFFSATLPAAVGLYWGVSTLFAIGQQEYIHHRRQHKDRLKSSSDPEELPPPPIEPTQPKKPPRVKA